MKDYLEKITSLLAFLMFAIFIANAQEPVTLKDCQQWTREYHPILKQKKLHEEISNLNLQNNATNYLPGVNINGQATYQSDVTSVAIDLPNVNIPSVSKDQYKMYLDVHQSVWDGGVTKALDFIEKSKRETNLQAVEVELYQVRSQVNQFFFASFYIQENLKILDRKKETLQSKREILNAGVKHGMVLPSDLSQIDAELIRLKQQQIELENSREIVHSALSILTGKNQNVFEKLELVEKDFVASNQINRPEIDLFESQEELLAVNSELLSKKRNPKIYGFGQAGYGKPGLNMLKNKFDAYYLVGVGMKWNVFDWKKTSREKKAILLQQELVQARQDQFEQAVQIGLDKELKTIRKLEDILESDLELIKLQELITKTSASKLENGTITTADYLQDLNAEIAARITLENHKIQLEEAKINYQNILGN